ncbi:MAG: DsbA family protein [Actinomycetota bacterium]|nr:DsbA family protein [Actinomycetota bacterium]
MSDGLGAAPLVVSFPGVAGQLVPATDQPVFYYDFASPEAYLAAERVVETLGLVPEWQPVRGAGLPGGGAPAFRCAQEREVHMTEIERTAAARGMQPLHWPPGWPADSDLALRVAAYAKSIGRVVAFSLAAFRQAYAAGRDLAQPDNVVIAAAACEMHPAAVLKAAGLRSVREGLERATAHAAQAGVREVPAVRVGHDVVHGDAGLEAAAAMLAEANPT